MLRIKLKILVNLSNMNLLFCELLYILEVSKDLKDLFDLTVEIFF